jgi:OPA family glycerol-3-phosphate transporter-like MFS transporter/OPA family sugar phosphate sensor protein UhpC-like MFS transporter
MIGDRVSAPLFMATGLLLSAVMNVAFGLSSAVVTLGVFWMINGWFQGIGFPPCARLLTHWFRPKELATKMSIWNTSHGLGLGTVVILCGYLVDRYHDWRLCFFVPAGLAVLTAVLLLIFLRDTPESVGLPPLEGTGGPDLSGTEAAGPVEAEAFGAALRRLVFGNPYVWIFSIANFFVYTIRYGVADWGPTMLKEYKHFELRNGGWMVAGFEFAGLIGTLLAGWLTDRVFGGRPARMSVVCMALGGVAIYLFWRAPAGNAALNAGLLIVAGFFIYGPQALIGIAAANLGTKRAAGTAVGLTGLFGYASTLLSGWGLGLMVQTYGWDRAFYVLLGAAAVGIVLFLMAWNAPRDGYATQR